MERSFPSGSSLRSRHAHVILEPRTDGGKTKRTAHGVRDPRVNNVYNAREHALDIPSALPTSNAHNVIIVSHEDSCRRALRKLHDFVFEPRLTQTPERYQMLKLRTLVSALVSVSDAVREGSPNAARSEYFLRLGGFSAVCIELVDGWGVTAGTAGFEPVHAEIESS